MALSEAPVHSLLNVAWYRNDVQAISFTTKLRAVGDMFMGMEISTRGGSWQGSATDLECITTRYGIGLTIDQACMLVQAHG